MKRPHRTAQPPRHVRRRRTFRRRMHANMLVQLSTCLHINLDAIAHDQADVHLLWDYVSTTLTFSHIAAALGEGEPEMAAQLELGLALIQAWARTGRVLFTPAEYELARLGVVQMEALIERCSLPIAVAAATKSEQQILAIKAANPTEEAAHG